MGLASTWRTEVVHLERWEEARTARIRGRLHPGWADPKPFARVAIFYGQPFTVGAGKQGLAAATATRAMADLVSEGHGTTTT